MHDSSVSTNRKDAYCGCTFHDQLMRPRNESQAVVMVERLRDILPKRVSGASGRDTPAAAIVRVGPEEIAHGALMRDLLNAIDGPHVVEGVNRRRKAAMKTEYLHQLR
jgi:hypothetical protein